MGSLFFGGYQNLNMPRPQTGGMFKRSTPPVPIVDFRLVGRTSLFPGKPGKVEKKPTYSPPQAAKKSEPTTPSYQGLVQDFDQKAPLSTRVDLLLERAEYLVGQKKLKGLKRKFIENKFEIIVAMRIVCPELTVNEIAEYLGCCTTSIYDAFKRYGIPTLKQCAGRR